VLRAKRILPLNPIYQLQGMMHGLAIDDYSHKHTHTHTHTVQIQTGKNEKESGKRKTQKHKNTSQVLAQKSVKGVAR
jgi:hypothetical protein